MTTYIITNADSRYVITNSKFFITGSGLVFTGLKSVIIYLNPLP
jgi:hypothetical protein